MFTVLVIVFVFFSWEPGPGPGPTDNDTEPIPNNFTDEPINDSTNKTTKKDPLKDQWICGNGIADPNEDCLSCPRDLPEECACLSASPGEIEADIGEQFCICPKQYIYFEDLSIVLENPAIHRLFVSMPSSETYIDSAEGEKSELWYWEDGVMHSYEVTTEKNIYHGVCMVVDYPLAEGTFSALNGETFRLEGTTFKVTLVDPDTIKLEIDTGDEILTEVVDVGDNVTVDGHVIEFEEVVDGGMNMTVSGGEGA